MGSRNKHTFSLKWCHFHSPATFWPSRDPNHLNDLCVHTTSTTLLMVTWPSRSLCYCFSSAGLVQSTGAVTSHGIMKLNAYIPIDTDARMADQRPAVIEYEKSSFLPNFHFLLMPKTSLWVTQGLNPPLPILPSPQLPVSNARLLLNSELIISALFICLCIPTKVSPPISPPSPYSIRSSSSVSLQKKVGLLWISASIVYQMVVTTGISSSINVAQGNPTGGLGAKSRQQSQPLLPLLGVP